MKIYKGNIITMDDQFPSGDYMVVDKGKIIEVGKGDAYRHFIDAQIIHLEEKTIIPGLWDSHLHIVYGMRSVLELNLRGCNSVEELKASVQNYAKGVSGGEWIIGHGWDQNKIFSGKFPDRRLLDQLCDTNPMVLTRMDGHSLCVNTLTMTLMQLDKLEPNAEVPFGVDGKPTGMFFENAAYRIEEKISEMLTDQQIEKLVLHAQDLFLQNGLCAVNDICTKYGRYFDIYKRLYDEGKLKVRITAAPDGSDEESVQAFAMRKPLETDRLKIGATKYFMDGTFGSRTALLFEDYADDDGNRGLRLIDDTLLRQIIEQNVDITLHAIGDLAVNRILNAFESLNNTARSRIEHIQIIKDSDIERFKKYGITASFQPVFLYEEDLTLSRLGSKRLPQVYRFKSMLHSGANVIFNSDWPYGGGDFPNKPGGDRYIGFEPLLGIHAACCKNFNKSETVTVQSALQAYTANAAFVNSREKELGKLKKGFVADFIVLDKDILNIDPDEIIDLEVLMTVIDGEIVYKKFQTNI